MEENKTINFIKNMWEGTIKPTFSLMLKKSKENTDTIAKAIEDKSDISVNNFDEAINPIVEAQNATTEAVKNIPVQVFPEVSFDSLESKLDEIKEAFEKKDLIVNIGETKLELSPVIKAIEDIRLSLPTLKKEEVIDYTMMFSEMMDIMERPKDDTHEKKMCSLMEKLAKTEDLAVIAEWLKVISEKEATVFPDIPRDKDGIPYFHPTKVGGGGGGGLTQIESTKLQALATEETLTAFKNKLPLTAFGDLRTAELSPIFQGSFEYTVDNTELTENSAVAPATVTQANGMAVVTTSTTAGKKASLKSKTHAKYMAGLGGLLRFTAIFTTPVAGTFQWAGIMDELGSTASFKNGFSIGYNGTSLCIARFQNDVLFQVNRDSWDDKLDGTGASGMTIDTTKLNVFEIRFQYLGGGAIQFFVEDDSTGNFVVFHKILYANLNTSPSVYNPNFHYFIFADNGATTNSIVVKSASYAYFIEGKSELSEIHQPQFSSGAKQKSAVTSEVAIFTLKVKTSYAGKTNFIPILIENIGASIEASSANNLGIIRLVRNTTLGEAPFYSDINTTDSVVSIDTAGITVTGGKTLMSFQLAGKNDKINERLLDLKLILQDGDTITLTGSSANSATINGNILWKELF